MVTLRLTPGGGTRGGLTATQVMAEEFIANGPDWITALWAADQFCSPGCSIYGPFAYFNQQYDSLAGISSIGRSNYNAMVVTLRKRYSAGVQFDVNYTLGYAKDHGSLLEGDAMLTMFAYLASERGVPPYVVFGDAALRAWAAGHDAGHPGIRLSGRLCHPRHVGCRASVSDGPRSGQGLAGPLDRQPVRPGRNGTVNTISTQCPGPCHRTD